ncbi:MAG: ATP-binding protein [bacterium]|nr:ATP-binding protein [bacterium]
MQGTQFILATLFGGFAIGSLARLIVPGSQRLTWSETTIVGIAGAGVGGLIANFSTANAETTALGWRTLLGALAGSVIILVVVSFLMKRYGWRQDQEFASTAQLVVAGENHGVEFKQTARWNIHSKQKDPRVELVIAKTVAGFLNSDGGVLLIGVDDDGIAVGLCDDLALMKEPDHDRFELWLTDLMERCLGKPAVANVRVRFEPVDATTVCRIDVGAAPAPVFLDEPGGNREADMYVRMGNSTRKLLTDEALEYVGQHW